MLRKKCQQVALTPEQFAESYDRLFRPEMVGIDQSSLDKKER